MTTEEILSAIRLLARKLGRNPGMMDLQIKAGISRHQINRRFGSMRKALISAGLRSTTGTGIKPSEATLLMDWARVARKLGKLPSYNEYRRTGSFSQTPFMTRYGRWNRVADGFVRYTRETRTEAEWRDVLGMIAARKRGKAEIWAAIQKSRNSPTVIHGRRVYGRPLPLKEMAHAPTDESGVIFLFALVASRLGFIVQHLQKGYPDCRARREIGRDQWQDVDIEFELESRNFVSHKHPRDGCDIIVCWVHNWKDCPLEVIELSKVVKETYETPAAADKD